MAQTNYITDVTTGKVRLSYANLFKPRAAQPGQDEKYSVTLLIPKTDTETLQRISHAIQAAVEKGKAEKWGGIAPANVPHPLHDGDGLKESGEPFGEECKGHYVMTASAKADYPPEVVDQRLNPVINQSDVYSGCYARVNINFFPYGGGTTGFKKGVGAGLGPVQKMADGEPLGGGTKKASSVFGEVEYEEVDPITGLPLN